MNAILRTPLARCAQACLALPLVLALAAPEAQAQKISVGFGKHGRHVSVGIGVGFGMPHCKPPVVVAPPHCPPPQVWVPGHYALVEKQVFVPGCVRQEYVPAVYETRTWRDYCGRLHVERIEVAPATWRTVKDPGTWRTVTERIWVEGRWMQGLR
ncbi:MAG: hypothetical protein IPK67_13820 [Planctomycetes bacterium]|nr:hypothetical protein [Planctomycetota bacterium]